MRFLPFHPTLTYRHLLALGVAVSILPLSSPLWGQSSSYQINEGKIKVPTTTKTDAPLADQMRKKCVAYITSQCRLDAKSEKILETELTRIDRKKMALWKERATLLKKIEQGDLNDQQYGQALQRILQIEVTVKQYRQQLYRALQPHFDNKTLSDIYIAMRHFKREVSQEEMCRK